MSNIHVKKRNGRLEVLNVEKINKVIARACEGLEDVSASEIAVDANLQFYDKIPTAEIDKALILTASSKMYKEPNYSYVAARLMLNTLYKEVFGEGTDDDTFDLSYRKSFISNIKKLVKADRFHEGLCVFDLKRLAQALKPERDLLFKQLGIKTLYDRYLVKLNGRRMETPQAMWMRVAMGLAANEKNPNERAIEFYDALSQFSMCSSTPTLFNSGTTHQQLSSCYLNTFDDSIDGIFEGLWQEARKSKYAGGLGFDVTPFRGTGAYIHGTNGASTGLIPWLKIFNDMLIGVNQGGRRPGAGCAYLEPWHIDVEEFLDLRRPTGDERRRTPNLNTALWIPDRFMRAIENKEDWYLFCPSECGDLHHLYGAAFDARYAEYIQKAEAGELSYFKKIEAVSLWKAILRSIFETSHPWLTFKDPSNLRYSNQHVGVVHSSNLCTEILLHTEASKYKNGEKVGLGETAVCNLGSINLPRHVVNGTVDYDKLRNTVTTAIRMLDNVIDINFYPTEEAARSNLRHRPIGLGIMGFHDLCHELGIQYDTDAGVELADEIQEFISYWAIAASSALAQERGKYKTYEGSLWSQGIFPVDTWEATEKTRFGRNSKAVCRQDWDSLRTTVAKFGMRNSNVMAIAPTATISYIQGCEQSIEPHFSVLFIYQNLSGDSYIINDYFVRDMKKEGLWSSSFAEMVKAVDGDVALLDIPAKYKEKYKTAFDRDMLKLIEAAGRRQIWIDMGQSFNMYNSHTKMSIPASYARAAWDKGLKTTYYWRNRAASKVEKSVTIEQPKQTTTEPQVPACSLEARARGEICESCQ